MILFATFFQFSCFRFDFLYSSVHPFCSWLLYASWLLNCFWSAKWPLVSGTYFNQQSLYYDFTVFFMRFHIYRSSLHINITSTQSPSHFLRWHAFRIDIMKLLTSHRPLKSVSPSISVSPLLSASYYSQFSISLCLNLSHLSIICRHDYVFFIYFSSFCSTTYFIHLSSFIICLFVSFFTFHFIIL